MCCIKQHWIGCRGDLQAPAGFASCTCATLDSLSIAQQPLSLLSDRPPVKPLPCTGNAMWARRKHAAVADRRPAASPLEATDASPPHRVLRLPAPSSPGEPTACGAPLQRHHAAFGIVYVRTFVGKRYVSDRACLTSATALAIPHCSRLKLLCNGRTTAAACSNHARRQQMESRQRPALSTAC